jgi:hypothetical protein
VLALEYLYYIAASHTTPPKPDSREESSTFTSTISMESLAAFRKSRRDDLTKLAEEHLKHDLQQSDRDVLRAAAARVTTHATIGSLLGLGLGVFMAYRLRSARTAMFNAFRAQEKPTMVQFANGRTGKDLSWSFFAVIDPIRESRVLPGDGLKPADASQNLYRI